jgi:hypothetical protein
MPFNPFGMSRMENIFSTPYDRPRKRFLGAAISGKNTPFNDPVDQDFFTPPEVDTRDEATRYFDEMEKIRKRRGPALTAYQEHIQNRPVEDSPDYKPSIWRRLASAAAAGAQGYQTHNVGSGIAVGEHVMRAPYERAVEEWGEKGKALGVSANLEREEQEDQLKSMATARALGLDYEKFRETRRVNDQKNQLEREQLNRQNRIADLTAARDAATDERSRRDYNARIYHERQLEAQAAATLAATRARDAQTKVRDSNTAKYQTDTTAVRREAIKATGDRRPPISATNQRQAKNNALRSMLDDPKWKQFVEMGNSTTSDPYMVKSDMLEHPLFSTFQRELQRRIDVILRLRPGSGSSDDAGDDAGDGVDDDFIDIQSWPGSR